MINQFLRTEMLFGEAAMDKLGKCRVAVFGIGGVGGFACEAMIRSGIAAFDLIDNDTVSLTNLNRQIIATHSSVGRYKVDVMKERMLDINPQADVRTYKTFVLPENVDTFPFDEYDYIVDAIDTVTAKIQIILKASEHHVPIISCMGAGNKLDGSGFRVADIYKTRYCPLAKVMRHEMKKRGISKLKVVYSEEPATRPIPEIAQRCVEERRDVPGSTSFVPSMAGLLLGGEVIKDLIREEFAAARSESVK